MSRATVTLPQDLLTELMTLVGAKSKTEAVLTAVKDEIRLRKVARIKAMAGEMEFTASADELRHGDRRLG
jgi:Arc/MetJ family transcription regulator